MQASCRSGLLSLRTVKPLMQDLQQARVVQKWFSLVVHGALEPGAPPNSTTTLNSSPLRRDFFVCKTIQHHWYHMSFQFYRQEEISLYLANILFVLLKRVNFSLKGSHDLPLVLFSPLFLRRSIFCIFSPPRVLLRIWPPIISSWWHNRYWINIYG